MKITVHCVVKNEDRWIWFALASVLPFVEEVLVFDTGSTDQTVDIIKTFNSPKIIFEEKGLVTREELVDLRREQLARTKTDWFLILDGDEIWPKKQLEYLIKKASTADKKIIALFNRNRNCIGDIFHYLPESTGHYHIADQTGNLTIRLIKKTKGLRLEGKYPLETFKDSNGAIQSQNESLLFADCWYLHTSYLQRSSSDSSKVSGSFGKNRVWEKGIRLDEKDLPEVFSAKYPDIVKDPLKKRSLLFETGAIFTTPLLSLKRHLK
jgi:glycosyltransferase involved in cell wall biosynthesis